MTYSILKTIGVASVTATMFIGTIAEGSPFNMNSKFAGLSSVLSEEITGPLAPETRCIVMPEFHFFGVDDQGLNDSRFFKMNLTVPENDPQFLAYFGELRKGYDIEALDSTDPAKHEPNNDGSLWSCLYLASGDKDNKIKEDGNPDCDTGCLYYLNKGDAKLSLFGDICTKDKDLEEVNALAFRFNPALGWEEIWGFSRQDGLFKIANPFPAEDSSLCGDNRKAVEAEMICEIPANIPVEDMTWVEKEGVFYVANGKSIYTLNPETCRYKKVCKKEHEIEALEYIYLPENELDLLVMGLHQPQAGGDSITAIDFECNSFPTTFPTEADVEGLTYP